LFFFEKVFDFEGFRPLRIERVFDLFCAAHLLPRSAPARLDVEDADGGRGPRKTVALAKAAATKGQKLEDF
jgi:hypothetical protein